MHESSLDGRSFPVQNSSAATMPFTGDSRMRSRLGTTLLAVCTLPLTVVVAQAQNPVSNGIRALAQRQTKNLVDAAEEMPADKYGYKPTPAQMSYGDVVAHLIKEGNNYLCSAASGMKQPDVDKFTGADRRTSSWPASRPRSSSARPRWLRSRTRSWATASTSSGVVRLRRPSRG